MSNNFNILLTVLLPIAQAHLTLLLKDGKIFDPVFRTTWLEELRSCPMCLGVYTATAVSLLAGFYSPVQILTIAGIGHVLFLLREKYIPCDKCKVPAPIPFKVVGL